MNKTVYYAHDPMCSWCWGFEPIRKQFFDSLPSDINVIRLVGGLAPDSLDVMPSTMQKTLQNTWRNIQKTIPGTQFNFDFWTQCSPRRSTYPSNRAVLAARLQGNKFDTLMTHRIQKAYYTEAKNPSDNAVLIELAKDIGLNIDKFSSDIESKEIRLALEQDLLFAHRFRLNSFPSLAYQVEEKLHAVTLDYANAENLLDQIKQIDLIYPFYSNAINK